MKVSFESNTSCTNTVIMWKTILPLQFPMQSQHARWEMPCKVFDVPFNRLRLSRRHHHTMHLHLHGRRSWSRLKHFHFFLKHHKTQIFKQTIIIQEYSSKHRPRRDRKFSLNEGLPNGHRKTQRTQPSNI